MASGLPRTASRAAHLARARPLRQPALSTRWSSTTTPETPGSRPAERKVVETSADPRPRWSFTPPLTQAPFSLSRPKDPRRSEWTVNEDPAVLDKFYERFLGPTGPGMLPEELKWLAVTHKSYDQGRRGFNDRLAYLGRQAVILEVTKDIVSATPVEPEPDRYGRKPFQHPSLDGITNLAETAPRDVLHPDKMHKLAMEIGLSKVLRWKPRLPENLAGSGHPIVLAGTIYAIVGAISLQHGGAVASRVIQEKIIKRLR